MSGKKLLFMGAEIGQWAEWNHDASIEWNLLEYEPHAGVKKWLSALNHAYANVEALHELDCDSAGFEWISADDIEQSVMAFLRKDKTGNGLVLVVCNFTPVPRNGYVLGVPQAGTWKPLLNSDDVSYGGSGGGGATSVVTSTVPSHGRPFSLVLDLPPLSTIFVRWEGNNR
ncbi:MAG: alpha amylase C-terminal domain-containing protein [Chloroflexota bacterium]